MFPNLFRNQPKSTILQKPDIYNSPLFETIPAKEEVQIVGGVPQKLFEIPTDYKKRLNNLKNPIEFIVQINPPTLDPNSNQTFN